MQSCDRSMPLAKSESFFHQVSYTLLPAEGAPGQHEILTSSVSHFYKQTSFRNVKHEILMLR